MVDKPWKEMTPEEKKAWRVDKWRNPGLPFTSPEAEADYTARVDRVLAALELRVPDRVPVCLGVGYWPGVLGGLTPYEVMTEPARAAKAWTDFNLKYQPDTLVAPLPGSTPSAMLEALDYRLYSWPGHGVAKEASFQYNEKEWMLADEYDELIADPWAFMYQTYLPRTVGAFAGFAGISSPFDFIELPFVAGNLAAWGSPAMAESLQKLATAAQSLGSWAPAIFGCMGGLMSVGFPGYYQGMTKAPFDILGDTLRGTRGVVTDLYRQPEKVVAACERLVPIAIDWIAKRPGGLGTPVVMLPLHKGADGFMNDEQFRTFYWPTLRAVLLGLIDEGLIPLCFAEGRFASRLETIMDLPKGKTAWIFDQTDMARAKETIGTVACLQGNMPLSLMHAGTTDEVAAYTRKLIETAGRDGGYILDFGAGPDDGIEANLAVMMETAKKYGRYS